MRRPVLAAALTIGALVGAVTAAVRAQEPAPVATPAPVTVPIDERPSDRDAQGRYLASVHLRRHKATLAARVDDPAGGLPWAVRVFDAERIALKRPARTLAAGQVVGRNRCVQLGRLQGDRFGWVYGDGRFRALGVEDQLVVCTSRKQPQPELRFQATLAIRDPAAPTIAGTVIWGLLPGATSATVAGSGGADGAASVGGGGAVLRVAGPDAHPGGARVSGGGHDIAIRPHGTLPSARGLPNGAAVIEAPAPDPAGGPRWGVAVGRNDQGKPCVAGPMREVDGRAGGVDLRLGIFDEAFLSPAACRGGGIQPSAKYPCLPSTGLGNTEEIAAHDAFLEQARVERRLLTGRVALSAQCSADVERVTLRTQRDIRTLVPSGTGNVVLAVYDGDFVDGELVFTAQLKSGRRWTLRFPSF